MIYDVWSKAARQRVATIEAMSLETATSNARNQALLFNRDQDDLFVCLAPIVEPNAERDRFGFAWLDGGAGERPRP